MRLLKNFFAKSEEGGGKGVQRMAEKIHYLRQDAFVDDPLVDFGC